MSPSHNVALAVDLGGADIGEPSNAANGPFRFEQGLYGFPDCRTFVLVPAGREGFFLLQSTEHDALCLLLADPFRLFRGYSVDLPKLEEAALGASGPEDIAILVTVTLPDGPGRACTANLQGPIAFNVRARLGRQIILNKPVWGVRESVYLPTE
jgi:flagellar assembly factor FliW